MTPSKAKEIIYELKENNKVPIVNTIVYREYINNDNKYTEWSYQDLVSMSEYKDKHVDDVIDKFRHRSEVGYLKYGTTLERNDLTIYQWLNHLMEELMDATLYISKIKDELNKIHTFGQNDSKR